MTLHNIGSARRKHLDHMRFPWSLIAVFISRGLVVKIPISSRRITQIVVLVILFLALASLAGQYYKHFVGDDPLWLKMASKLDVNREGNSLPTWYQTISLFFCSWLLAIIAAAKSAAASCYARHWAVMALIFLYLSADEFLGIHEHWEVFLPVFVAQGAFTYAWVIPGSVFVLLFVLAYLRFLFQLPPRTRWLFVSAGALYITGALGMEMVNAYFVDSFGDRLAAEQSFTYAVLNTIEEVLEMVGIVVFINGLVSYIALHHETAEVTAKAISSDPHAG
jgi:hypothetical protein